MSRRRLCGWCESPRRSDLEQAFERDHSFARVMRVLKIDYPDAREHIHEHVVDATTSEPSR